MKKQILSVVVLISAITIANAQTGNVGINTTNPQATLEVTGVPTDPTKLDGVIAPRLTGDQLAAKIYTTAQTGAIVYATAAAGSLTGQVINVSSAGYYYFDGTVWQVFKTVVSPDINIYKDNGTLTANRTMTMAGNILTMDNAGTDTVFNHNFGESRITNTGATRGTFSAFSGDSALSMYVDNGSAAQVVSSGTSTGLTVGTNNATNLSFYTNSNEKATLTSAGNMGIDTASPTQRLDIGSGNVRIRDINTNVGTSTDKVVVVDPTGVLKSMAYLPGLQQAGYMIKGTAALNIAQGSTVDVPGVTVTHTVPAGVSAQTLVFTIVGYAVKNPNGAGGGQGVFELLQDGVKVTSAYTSVTDSSTLINLPMSTTLLHSVTLPPGTYTFKVRYAAWLGAARVNNVPSAYLGYNGDNEAMLTRMKVEVYNQ